MGHIKEPKGIDFVIESDPLTQKDRKQISKFISDYKTRMSHQKTKSSLIAKQRKVNHA